MYSLKYFWLLFLIWPFLAFILALRNGFNKHYQPIILAFSFLYGYGVYLYSGDILRYEEAYKLVVNYQWSDFFFLLTNKFDSGFKGGYKPNLFNLKPDVFAIILSFFTSRISEDPRLFWGVLSVIYTWFMLLFFNQVKLHFHVGPKRYWHYIFIFFLILIIPKYVGISGVRFWPALFLFMYYLMVYLNSGRRLKYIFLLSLSILIHYSFFIPVVIVVIVHFLPIKMFVFRTIVLVSLSFFTLSSTTSIFAFLSGAVEVMDGNTVGESASSYANQEIYQQRKAIAETRNWYVTMRSESILYILLIATLIEAFGLVRLQETSFTYQVFPFLIVFFCLTLLTYYLGSVGRFKNIFFLLALTRYTVLFPFNYQSRFIKVLVALLVPTLTLYILVTFRSELYFVESTLFVNNVIGIFFSRSKESLSEFLIGH